MFTPFFTPNTPITADRKWSDETKNMFEETFQQMQLCLSEEGFRIPMQTQQNIDLIAANPSVPAGTLLFNVNAINGGSSDAPNGQLCVKLADGTFHFITNT